MEAMREGCPVRREPHKDVLVVTGYDDVRELLHTVRDGAHGQVRQRAGLENDSLDTDPPGARQVPRGPVL